MHNTNDDILINYRPDSLQEGNYIADIEAIIENGAYHSDEVSETDDEKTQEEVSRHIQLKNKNKLDLQYNYLPVNYWDNSLSKYHHWYYAYV